MQLRPRVPETDETGGAILDMGALDMEQYSRCAKRFIGAEYRKLIHFLLQDLHLPRQGRVLEIGSGPGWIGISGSGSRCPRCRSWALSSRPT